MRIASAARSRRAIQRMRVKAQFVRAANKVSAEGRIAFRANDIICFVTNLFHFFPLGLFSSVNVFVRPRRSLSALTPNTQVTYGLNNSHFSLSPISFNVTLSVAHASMLWLRQHTPTCCSLFSSFIDVFHSVGWPHLIAICVNGTHFCSPPLRLFRNQKSLNFFSRNFPKRTERLCGRLYRLFNNIIKLIQANAASQCVRW